MAPLGTHELPVHEVTAAIAAPGQSLYYLPNGCITPWPSALVPMVHTRAVFIPRLDTLDELQAARREWCAAAGRELGQPVSRIDPAMLLRPTPRSPWARAAPGLRARLLSRAIVMVAEHATELPVFDQRELRVNFDGVAIEHLFFGLVRYRAECEGEEIMLVGSGGEEPGPPGSAGEGRWLLRLVFTENGRVWRRGVVLAPEGALAGVELATVAGEVVARMLERRTAANTQRPSANEAANSPPPLAPALAAALEAGATVLAPRIKTLIPPDTDLSDR